MLSDVGALEQLVLGDRLDAGLRGRLGVEVLAPRDHLHLERLRDLGDPLAEPPEADEAERAAGSSGPIVCCQPPVAHVPVLLGDVPRERDDQPPGQLDASGAASAAGAAHGDAARGGVHVDRGVRHAGRDQQLEVGQRGEPRGR